MMCQTVVSRQTVAIHKNLEVYSYFDAKKIDFSLKPLFLHQFYWNVKKTITLYPFIIPVLIETVHTLIIIKGEGQNLKKPILNANKNGMVKPSWKY